MALLLKTFSILFLCINFTFGVKYKICALDKHKSYCDQLVRHDNIQCEYVENQASCLTKIDSGEIDFGSIDAETGFLGAQLTQNVVPAALMKWETNVYDYEYETVIVSKENFTSLDGMSYCHPGFKEMDMTTPLILKEFEQHVFKKNSNLCETKFETSIEWEIFSLDKIFGRSCRPGPWTVDDKLNTDLHNKYPKLTELCPNLSGKPFERSLDCMLHTENSISLTSLNTVNNFVAANRTLPLYYYCKNGSVSKEPCVWSKQPYKFLVRNKDKGDLQADLSTWFIYSTEPSNKDGSNDRDLTENEKGYVKAILEAKGDNIEMRYKFVNNNTGDNLKKFIKDLRDIPSPDDSLICKRRMRWCTISTEEQIKCNWLAQASVNYGIQPIVQCIQKSSELECLLAINSEREEADLITTPADYGYAAKRFGLSAVAFPETMGNQEINTLLLIKNKSIERLENLKGKKGCFPVYSGIAWLSLVETLRGIVLPNETCDYGKLLSDFLGDSCMPGAEQVNRANKNTVDAIKMCKLCTDSGKTCDAKESTNWYFNNSGALKCLEDRGDFAVIVKDSSVTLPNDVRIMCKNGTFSTIDDGLNVDEDCYLSSLTTSEVVTRIGDPLNRDIELALREYDSWFASNIHTPFRLFDSFNGTKDLLFKDSTPGLSLPSSQIKVVKNYVELFKHIDDCAKGSTEGPSPGMASVTFITTTLLVCTTIFMNIFV